MGRCFLNCVEEVHAKLIYANKIVHKVIHAKWYRSNITKSHFLSRNYVDVTRSYSRLISNV